MFAKEWSFQYLKPSAYRNSWLRRAIIVTFAVFAVCANDEAQSQEVVDGKGTAFQAVEIDSAVLEMADLIDQQIDAGRNLAGNEPSPTDGDNLCNDEEFLRRAYLDLVGVNPEPTLVVDYLNDGGADKRRRAVHNLVQSPMFSIRLADQWTDLLLAEDANVPQLAPQRESLRRWLHRKFSDNVRYDRIVAELLVSSGGGEEQPTAFFTALEVKPEKLAEKTCRVFLGVALDCAQCHDHPFDTWKQSDFWGVAAYFAQVNARTTDGRNDVSMAGGSIVDVEAGDVYLPETTTIVAPKPLVTGIESSLGIGSRRQQLAIWLTSRQNPWFARAAVNRVWSMMMGRGFIEPVDDMGKNSVASHPELLNRMAEFFRKSGYDLKRLHLAIACSKTYARRAYRMAASNPSEGNYDPSRFGAMISKPLTARQLASCLRQAARQSPQLDTDVWTQFASEFGKIRGDGSEYAGGVLQSLGLQHSAITESVWKEVSSKLLTALKAPHLSPQEQIDWMYLSTLARYPSAEERALTSELLAEAVSDEQNWQARADLLWALINSTEFGMTP